MASRVVGSLRSPLRAVPIATVVGASPSCPLFLSASLLGSGGPVLWVVVSTVDWMVEPAGAIGLVVVVGSIVSVVVETAWAPVLFPLSFAFSTFVWTGLSAWFLGGWLCEDVCQLDGVLDHVLTGLFESHSSSHLHGDLPGECVPSCLDLLEAIVVSPGKGLKSLDKIVDVDFVS